MEGTANEAMMLTTTTTEIENIGDIIEIHMSHLATMCSINKITFSEEDLKSLNFFHGKVQKAFSSAWLRSSMIVVQPRKLCSIWSRRSSAAWMNWSRKRQRKFLQEDHTPQEMAAFTLQTDIMENLKRIYEHSKRIGKLVLKQEGGTALATIS